MGLIANGKTPELFLIILASFITIGITVRLGIQLLKARFSLLGFIIGIMFLTTYAIVSRLFLPVMISVIGMIPLMGLALAVLCKVKYMKAFWVSCILMLGSFIGETILGAAGLIFKNLGRFILLSPHGIAMGILSETIIPMVAIVFKIELSIPPQWKTKEALMNASICFLEAFILLWSLINFYSKKMQLDDFILLIVVSTLFCLLYFLNSSHLKKQHKKEVDIINENIEYQAEAIQEEISILRQNQSQNRRKYDKLPPHVKDRIESFLYDSTIFTHNVNQLQNAIKEYL